MIKKILLSFSTLTVVCFSVFFYINYCTSWNVVNNIKGKSIYDLSVKSLNGKSVIRFSDFKGKKILFVNTASKCGYTSQYEGLQKLQDKYKGKLVVIGLPCNQFLSQEPGTAEEIESFCKKNYGVTFLLSEKIDVKGENQHPVYQWLCQKENNQVKDVTVGWNFGKFLIDEKGNFVEYFPSKTEPLSEELTSKL